MTPLVGVVGLKNTGKTTLIRRLIAHYSERGLRVGVIKHDAHGFAASPPGTDTAAFASAGAHALAIASKDGHVACEWRLPEEPSLHALAERLGAVDLIIVEGYKEAPIAKWVLLSPADEGAQLSSIPPYAQMITRADEILGWLVPRQPFAIADHQRQVYHRDDIEVICNRTAQALACPWLQYAYSK